MPVTTETLATRQWFVRYRQRGEPLRIIGPFATRNEAVHGIRAIRKWLGRQLAEASIYATRKQAACHIRARR